MSFRTRTGLEQLLANQGMPQKMSGFLTFIFPFFYQYYVVYNAEDRYYQAQMVRQAYAQGHPGAPYQQGGPYPGSYPQGGAPHPSQYQQAMPPQYAHGTPQQPPQPAPQHRAPQQNSPTPPPPPRA